jgi:hypothetical protein
MIESVAIAVLLAFMLTAGSVLVGVGLGRREACDRAERQRAREEFEFGGVDDDLSS